MDTIDMMYKDLGLNRPLIRDRRDIDCPFNLKTLSLCFVKKMFTRSLLIEHKHTHSRVGSLSLTQNTVMYFNKRICHFVFLNHILNQLINNLKTECRKWK